ncbi:MAG: hypothetical protein AAGG48_04120 [Planctomycetota bacterium]
MESKTNASDPEFNRFSEAQRFTESELSLWDIAGVPMRYWRRVSACFVVLMMAFIVITAMLPKKYQSEAKLLVRLGRENMGLDPTATLGNSQNINMTQTRQSEINSVATVLGNRNLAERVVNEIGAAAILGRTPKDGQETDDESPSLASSFAGQLMPSMLMSSHEKAIRSLQKKIKVEPVVDSNLVSVSYTSDDPELSREIVATLVEFYLEEHAALHRSEGTYEFLLNEKEAVQTALRSKEDQLRRLKSETGLVSPAEQRAALVTRIARLQDQHSDVVAQTAEVAAEVKMLREKFAGLSETLVLEETKGAANFASDGMREQLYGLQLTEKRLLASHTEAHPQVIRIRKQIQEAQKILAKEQGSRTEVTTGPNRVFEETQLELIKREPVLSALQVKERKISELLSGLEQNLQSLNQNELEVARLAREVEIQDASYRKYSLDTEQARIDNSLLAARLSNINIAQPATFEPYPSSPKTKLTLLLSFVFALSASIALAFASDSYDRWCERSGTFLLPQLNALRNRKKQVNGVEQGLTADGISTADRHESLERELTSSTAESH